LSCAFSPIHSEHLITLAGEPDWKLLFWQWDRFQLNFTVDIGKANLQAELDICNYQVSLRSNQGADLVVVVTGPNTYQYMKINMNFKSLEDEQEKTRQEYINYDGLEDELVPVNGNSGCSRNITCHVWSKDSDSLVCCTDLGDILVMDYLGKLKIICSESPRGYPIHSITCFDRGIIVGGADGFISTFGGTNDHDPYKEMQGFIGHD
jgi:hypothetical protein